MSKSQSMYKKIGIASAIMMVSVFLSRILGLAKEMVIAYIGGTGSGVDAYNISFIIPEFLNHVLASGFLSITFIPIFTNYLSQEKEKEGWETFSVITTVFGTLLIILILIAIALAPLLSKVVGFEDPDVLNDAIRMTRVIIPAQLFFFLGGLLMAVQYAKERFFFPALAPLVYNLGIICGGLFLGGWLGMDGFVWGALGGAFLGNFLIQLIGARSVGMRFRPVFKLKHPDLKKYILLTAPLMVGMTMTFSTEIFSKLFGSYLPEGSVASLNYSLRLMFVLVGIFGQAAGMASYPFLSGLVAQGKMGEVNKLLNNTLRLVIIVIPFSALMMVLRSEIIQVIFQRGNFDVASTDLTAKVLVFVLIGTVAYTAQTVVTRGYYASQNTLFPSIFGSVAVLLSIPIYLVGLQLYGIYGVALALSLSALLQVGLLYILWNRRTENSGAKAVYKLLFKVALLAAMLGIAFEWFRRLLHETSIPSSFWGASLIIGIIGIGFVVCFLALSSLFRISEVSVVFGRLKKRLLRR